MQDQGISSGPPGKQFYNLQKHQRQFYILTQFLHSKKTTKEIIIQF